MCFNDAMATSSSAAKGSPAATASNAAALALLPESPSVHDTIALLRRHSLAGAAQQEIERLIASGELGPGDKLTEAMLTERLGVSRGPVREAFRVLEEAGLLRLEKNRGVFVRQIPLEEALEIFDLRAILEAHVGATLATGIEPGQLARLEELVAGMEKAVKSDDESGYYGLNIEFHETMVAAAGNQKLFALYRRLTRELSLFRRRNLSDQKLLMGSIREHRDMLAAIKSRNPERAAAALRDHVLASRERTLRNATPGHPGRRGAAKAAAGNV